MRLQNTVPCRLAGMEKWAGIKNASARLREVHEVVDELNDIATASLLENWIDETERRAWFLFEASRN